VLICLHFEGFIKQVNITKIIEERFRLNGDRELHLVRVRGAFLFAL